MNLQDARKKLPELNGLSDESALNVIHQVYYPNMDKADLASRLGYKPQQAAQEIKNPGFFRGMGDVVLSLGQGVVGSVKSLTDLAGADNVVSQGLESASKGIETLKSDESQQARQQHMQAIKAAEESGSTWEEVKAYANMIWDMPAESIAQGIGSFATLGVGKAAQALKMAQSAKAAGVTKEAFLASQAGKTALDQARDVGFKTNLGVGMAQGVGAVKGAQFEQTFNNAKAQGMTDEQAQALATEAQAYGGQGTMQQMLGGGLGYLAAKTGPVEKLVAGQRTGAGGIMQRTLGGFAVEGTTEGVQGGQERYAGNTAAIDAGVLDESKRWSGVVGQGVSEGMVGGVLGGGAGVMGGGAQPNAGLPNPDPQPAGTTPGQDVANTIRAENVVPETGPMTRAANVATEIKAQQAEREIDASVQNASLTGASATSPMQDALAAQGEPAADQLPDAGNMVGDHFRDATKMVPDQSEQPLNMVPDVIGRTVGDRENAPYSIQPEAQKDLQAQGLTGTHEVVSATNIDQSLSGFLIVRKPDGAAPVAEPAPATNQVAEPETKSASDKPATLPKNLAGAKEGYNYGKKAFNLTFDNDIDRAAYITALSKPDGKRSAKDADYLKFAMDATGMTEAEVRAHGQKVRDSIKGMAKGAEPGKLTVPKVYAPKAAPAAKPADDPLIDEGTKPAAPDVTLTNEGKTGDQDQKARWLKAINDENRLTGGTGVQLSVTDDGKLTYLGDPGATQSGRRLLKVVDEARKAGATSEDIAASIRAAKPTPPATPPATPLRVPEQAPAAAITPETGKDAQPAPAQAPAVTAESGAPVTKTATKKDANALFGGKALADRNNAVPPNDKALDEFSASGKQAEFDALLKMRRADKSSLTEEQENRFFDLRTERNQAVAAVENAALGRVGQKPVAQPATSGVPGEGSGYAQPPQVAPAQDQSSPQSRWTRATTNERIAIARAGGIALKPAENVAKKAWDKHDPVVQENLARGLQKQEAVPQDAQADMPKNPEKSNTSEKRVDETAKNEQVAEGQAPKPKRGNVLTGAEIAPHGLEVKELRERIKEWAKGQFSGNGDEIINRETGNSIFIQWQGMKHAIAGANEVELRLLPRVRFFVQDASYLGSEPDKSGRADIVAVHKYSADATLKGEKFELGIVVRERKDGLFFYDQFIIKNESPLGVSGTATESTFPALGLQPASGDTAILSGTRPQAKPKRPQGGTTLRKSAYDKNPLLTLLATKGLFHDKDQKGSLKSEFSPDKQIMVSGYGPVFKKSGLKLDALLDFAIEDGYLSQGASEQELYRLIQRAVSGEKISPSLSEQGLSNMEAEFAAELQSRYEERPDDANDQEWYGQDEDGYADEWVGKVARLSDADEQRLADAIDAIWDSPASAASTRDAMEALGFTEQEIQDEGRRSIPGADEVATQEAGRGDGQGQVEAQAKQSPGAEAQTEGLTSYTAEEIRQQKEASDKATQGRAQQEREAEQRAQADAQRDDFTLTGSDRDADVAAARGQQDIFGNAAPADQAPETTKLTKAEAADLMAWESLGTKGGVTKHILTFFESKADKDANRGRMTVATVTKGDRSASAWMVDGDDQTFGPLSLAKKRGMEVGMAKAVADGFVEGGEAKQPAQDQAPAKAKKKPQTAKQKREALENHFRPGNVIQSDYWKDFDRVVDFAWNDGSWKVTVEKVVKDGEGWKATEGKRTHMTKPDARDKVVFEAPEAAPEAEAEPAPAKEAEQAKPAKIEDSGEVLEGARKLYAKSYAAKLDEGTGMETASVPLSKSWPEPDYQRLIEEGADPWAVALARAVRDEIPTKPTKAWKLKGWVAKVEGLREMAQRVMDGSLTKERFTEEAGKFKLDDWLNKVDLYEAVGHAESLKGMKFAENTYSFFGGQKFDPPKKLWTVNAPSTSASATWSNGNWGNDLVVADTKAEAIEKFKAWVAEQAAKAEDGDGKPAGKRTEFDVYSYRNNPKVFIVGKRISATKSIDLMEFESAKDARAFIAANQDKLETMLAEAKAEQSERREENAPRVGDDHRQGGDVTTEQFRETFGFRGEQFGASMPQGERQANLNQAYDALMDLAGVIGVPPKALSLNGELGLAFGARGHGGKNPAMAHYEPDATGAVTPNRVVINLTRKNGAGSLAHEWFHAVDNYFARMRGEKGGMLTESYPAKREGVRPEMVDAFKKVMMAIQSTGVRERSKNMDKKRTKDYWSTGLEMAARSFESYVIAKLQDKSGANDYLANILPESAWLREGSYPYPTMGELPLIRAAFDNFFATVQTKETDKGVAMFSRGQPLKGMAKADAQDVVNGITDRWANAPEVVVVQDMNDPAVPEAVRAEDAKQKSQGASGEPEGFWYDGKAYIVAGALRSPGAVVRVLLHETLGHYGLRGTFGDGLTPILKQLVALRRTEVSAKAEQYGLDMSIEADRLTAAEEVLAEMAQSKPEIGFVKRVITLIRGFLRKHVPGFAKMQMTDEDIIANYILPARKFVERGPGGGSKGGVSFGRGQDGGDVNFSRTMGATELAGQVRDKLNETFNHPGKLSWWHKTVGSQYNLAERNPAFKKVFDAAQSFINDVSYYGTESANMAPKMLPKLETLRDLTKTAISAADNKAVAAPVFEGTLSWARDADGKPIRIEALEKRYENLTDDQKAQMLLRKNVVSEAQLKDWRASKLDVYTGAVRNRFESTFLKPGVRWTDAELKSIFKLNDEQVGLYKEFRAATDTSLDNMAKAQMLREAGKDVEAMRDAVMEAPDVDTAAMMLRETLLDMAKDDPGRADVLTDAASGVMDAAAKINELKKQGYAPLSRFGRFTVDVVVDGQRQYFGLFESEADSNKMAAKMRMEFGVDNVAQGTMSQKEFELFQGITPESLELFGNMMGLDSTGNEAQDKAFQTYLKLTKNNRSAMKRLIHRQGIAGYSEDVGRVLAAFVYANARQTSAALHIGQMDEAITAIPKGEGELKDHALELAKYVKEPREEAAALRGLLFAQYLGGSVASAMVNFTQPLTVSIPYLSQFGGLAKAGKAWAQAVKDMSKGTKLEAGLERALKDAEESGVVSPQEVHQLMAQARGAASLQSGDGTRKGDAMAMVNNGWTRTTLAWGKFFGYAEQVNRRSTFIAAYRMAVDQKIKDPSAFAAKAVNETQFINNKANKMKFGRGAIGATLMTFKSYSLNWLELMHRLSTQDGAEGKLAAAYMLGALLLVAGTGGLPFVEDIDDLLDAIGQKMGYNFSTKKAKQEFLEGLFGKAGADFVDRGITGIAGVPIDISGRMGMGNLIPGTGLLLEKRDSTRDAVEVLGPAADLAKRAFQAVGKLVEGEVFGAEGALMTAAPRAVANVGKGVDMLDTGMYRDMKGAKVIDTTPGEAVAKMIGFQPQSVSKVQESNFINQRAKDFYSLRTQEIRAKWAMGIFLGDQDKVKEARQMMDDWNQDNPDQRMTANMPAIVKKVREMRKDKAQRIADTAPKAMRAQMRADARELAGQ